MMPLPSQAANKLIHPKGRWSRLLYGYDIRMVGSSSGFAFNTSTAGAVSELTVKSKIAGLREAETQRQSSWARVYE